MDGERIRILVACEDPVVRRERRQQLRRALSERLSVRGVPDAAAVAEHLRETGADLVLAAATLPDAPAGEVARALRETLGGTPLVVMDDGLDFGTAETLMRTGATAVLPGAQTTDDQLAEAVHGALDARGAPRDRTAEAGGWRVSFSQLASHTSDGVLMVDGERVIRFCNARAAALLGRSEEALLGSSFVYPFARGEETDLQVRRADGPPRLVSLTAAPTRWEGRDATLVALRERRTEQALREWERRTEIQLRDVQRMEVLGRLATRLAQDWNNLLTVILGRCEMARVLPGVDTGLAAHLQGIQMGARRASMLTRQFLALGERTPGDEGPTDWGEALAPLEPVLATTAGAHIDLSIRVAPEAGPVRLEPVHAEQMVANLVLNARDAMPTGGTLAIEIDATDIDGVPATRLRVRDTGLGMAPDVLARAREPFFTTKEDLDAHGLGLTTVQGIVREQGGRLDIQSVPRDGTTVDVVLPAEAPRVAAPDEEATPRREGGTVLLVEDEVDVCHLARDVLATAGWTVLEAHGGNEGLRLAHQHAAQLDLILADVILPGITGPEMVRRLEASRGPVPTLYMSGYAPADIQRRGLLPIDARYLAKPFTPEELVRAAATAAGRPLRASA